MTAKEYLSQARFLDMRINSKLQQIASLNDLAEENLGRFAIQSGNRFLINRTKFEKYLSESSAV